MKKFSMSILIAIFLMLMFQPWKVEAAVDTDSGTFGEALTWEYENGTLTISGEGYTSHFLEGKRPPWYYLRNKIHTIVVNEGVTFLGDGVFLDHRNVTKVQLHSGITYIGIQAFKDCYKLEEINIPDGVTGIDHKAFYNCKSLKKITIPNSVTYVGSSVFHYCTSLESVTLSNSQREVGQSMFRECVRLTSITLPRSVYRISDYAFSGCESLKKVEILGSIEKVEEYAFSGCRLLEYLDFSASLRYIGNQAFSGCKTIKEIRFHGDMPEIVDSVFGLGGHEDSLCNLYYPVNNKTWTQEKMEKELWTGSAYAKFVPYDTSECDHKVAIVDGKTVTCTEKGLTGELYCSKCKKILSEHSTIEPLGHDYGINSVQPTCTEAGYVLLTCVRCQNEEYQEKAALGHSFGEWETTKEPTVREAGIQTRSCTRCKEQQNQEVAFKTLSLTDYIKKRAAKNTVDISTEKSGNQDIDNTQDPFSQWLVKVIVPILVILLVAAIFFARQYIKKSK